MTLRRRMPALAVLALVAVTMCACSPGGTPETQRRYADGIPMELKGQEVLRGAAAIAAARNSVDSTPFLVGLWATRLGPGSFGAWAGNTLDTGRGGMIGDEPGFLDPELQDFLMYDHFDRAGPVVLRVHTHDAKAEECAAENRDRCMHLMLVEGILWRGDKVTDPKPISVIQAAAAFEVSTTPFEEGWRACAMYLPGVTVLAFPGGDDPMEGIVAIFPSREAVQRLAPAAAAAGESDTLPAGVTCPHDPSTHIHWLVRANVVVGVQYDHDPSIGFEYDPWVQFARQALGRLPD
jgi:hypothetical protein